MNNELASAIRGFNRAVWFLGITIITIEVLLGVAIFLVFPELVRTELISVLEEYEAEPWQSD